MCLEKCSRAKHCFCSLLYSFYVQCVVLSGSILDDRYVGNAAELQLRYLIKALSHERRISLECTYDERMSFFGIR